MITAILLLAMHRQANHTIYLLAMIAKNKRGCCPDRGRWGETRRPGLNPRDWSNPTDLGCIVAHVTF